MGIRKAWIIEQEESVQKHLYPLIDPKKWTIETFCQIEETSLSPDLIFCRTSSISDSFAECSKKHPSSTIVLLSEKPTSEEVVDVIRQGAFDVLSLPIKKERVAQTIKRIEKLSNSLLSTTERIIAESSLMKEILRDLDAIAQSSASVFIAGESGTGKEVIAHALHERSLRANSPFVKINCAALPENLLESELFGHEKGSFTGAIQRRIGRFEKANRGTLLLDEITEMPLNMQAKLLRAIQEKEIERVGGNQTISVDVRFVATSNRNLQEAIEQKAFREDLFYRLNVVPLNLPPLRERKEDILPLAHYFLERFSKDAGKKESFFSPESEKELLAYHWPGNIRQLANVIERSVVMSKGQEITLNLDQKKKEPLSESLPYGISLQELEKRLILETLKNHKNNRTKTAEILGISIRTLRNKLASYDLG